MTFSVINDTEITTTRKLMGNALFQRCTFTGSTTSSLITIGAKIEVGMESCVFHGLRNLRFAPVMLDVGCNFTMSNGVFFDSLLWGIVQPFPHLIRVQLNEINVTFCEQKGELGFYGEEGLTFKYAVLKSVTLAPEMFIYLQGEGPIVADSIKIYDSTVNEHVADIVIGSLARTNPGNLYVDIRNVKIGPHQGKIMDSSVHILVVALDSPQPIRIQNCCFSLPESRWVDINAYPEGLEIINVDVSDDCCNEHPLEMPYGVIADQQTIMKVPYNLKKYFNS
jgi:hypothetical protein